MQNRFIKNIIFLLFLNLLVKPFWILGIDREVQNILGDAAYGTYQALFNFSYLFYILLDLGITNFNSRAVAQDPKNLSKHFGGLTEIKLLLGLLYAVVIFVVGYFCGYNEGMKLKLLCWCGLNQILLSFILFLRSNMQGLLLFKQDSILSVFDRVLAIIIMGLVLWSGWFPMERFNAIWYLQAQTLAYICTLVLALTIVLRHANGISFKINFQFFKEILRQSLPFALLVLLMSVYSRIEPVLLERLLDDEGVQAGFYSRAYRLFDAGNNISNLFAIMLLPMFAATLKNKLELNNLVKTSFNVIVAMAGIVMIMCVFYRQEIMQLMYLPADANAADLERVGQYANIFPTQPRGRRRRGHQHPAQPHCHPALLCRGRRLHQPLRASRHRLPAIPPRQTHHETGNPRSLLAPHHCFPCHRRIGYLPRQTAGYQLDDWLRHRLCHQLRSHLLHPSAASERDCRPCHPQKVLTI